MGIGSHFFSACIAIRIKSKTITSPAPVIKPFRSNFVHWKRQRRHHRHHHELGPVGYQPEPLHGLVLFSARREFQWSIGWLSFASSTFHKLVPSRSLEGFHPFRRDNATCLLTQHYAF